MPTFAKHANSAKAGLMTAKEIELLAKWLRGELEQGALRATKIRLAYC